MMPSIEVLIAVDENVPEYRLRTCLGACVFQTKNGLSFTFLVSEDRDYSLIDEYHRLFPHVALAVRVFSEEVEDAICHALEKSSADYVLLAQGKDRLHEYCAEALMSRMGDGKSSSYDVVCMPFAVSYDGGETYSELVAPKRDRIPQRSMVAGRFGDAYWGKVWNRQFLLDWIAEGHRLDFRIFSLAPVLISRASSVLYVRNKREPLYCHCADAPVVFADHSQLVNQLKNDERLLSQGSEAFLLERTINVMLRALRYGREGYLCPTVQKVVSRCFDRVLELGGYLSDDRMKDIPPAKTREIQEIRKMNFSIPLHAVACCSEEDFHVLSTAEPFVDNDTSWELLPFSDSWKEDCATVLDYLVEHGGVYFDHDLAFVSFADRVVWGRGVLSCDVEGKIDFSVVGFEPHHPLAVKARALVNECQDKNEFLERLNRLAVVEYGLHIEDAFQSMAAGVSIIPSSICLYPVAHHPVSQKRSASVEGGIVIPRSLIRRNQIELEELQKEVVKLRGMVRKRDELLLEIAPSEDRADKSAKKSIKENRGFIQRLRDAARVMGDRLR